MYKGNKEEKKEETKDECAASLAHSSAEDEVLSFTQADDSASPTSHSPVARPPRSPKKPARPKSTAHVFAESPYADVQMFIDALAGTDYENADLRYYHEVIRNWAESKDPAPKYGNWLAMMRNWMLRDAKDNKLKTAAHINNGNGTQQPTGHRGESLADVGTAVDQYLANKYGG